MIKHPFFPSGSCRLFFSGGPAVTWLDTAGYDFDAIGAFSCNGGIPDIIVQNIRDEVTVSSTVRFDTRMNDGEPCIALARTTLSQIENW